MIFLDESGKRWKHIKVGSSVVSTSLFLPFGALVAAAIFLAPSWGSFSLPRPFSQPQNKKATTQVLGSSTTATKPATATKRVVKPAQSTTIQSAGAVTNQSAPLPATSSYSPTATSPTPTKTPITSPIATQAPGTLIKPLDPGKSAYGQSHKTTHS